MAGCATEVCRSPGGATCLCALLMALCAQDLVAGEAAAAAGTATAPAANGIRIDFGQLTEQPGHIVLQQAVITEEDRRGNALKTIRSEHAESNGLDATNSTWTFTGQVVVTIPEGELHADRATALIQKGRVSSATVEGKPATFEQRSPEGGVRARGRADDIRYDAATGDLLFNGNVWFSSESTGEVTSGRAKYNILQRTSSFERGDNERVHGTIRLKPRNAEPGGTP